MTTPYLTESAADALAATLPALPAWSAATTPQKSAALVRATLDVDNAMPYQGRRYASDQERQFPRAPYDDAPGTTDSFDRDPRASAWDWDTATNAAVVPEDVLLAVLLQADANLAGDREARLSSQHDGVVYDQTGSLAESYKQTEGPGVTTGLCRAAWVLLRKYRLKSGGLL
jgi:hypothetical protein